MPALKLTRLSEAKETIGIAGNTAMSSMPLITLLAEAALVWLNLLPGPTFLAGPDGPTTHCILHLRFAALGGSLLPSGFHDLQAAQAVLQPSRSFL